MHKFTSFYFFVVENRKKNKDRGLLDSEVNQVPFILSFYVEFKFFLHKERTWRAIDLQRQKEIE